jgi:hypothetical protein
MKLLKTRNNFLNQQMLSQDKLSKEVQQFRNKNSKIFTGHKIRKKSRINNKLNVKDLQFIINNENLLHMLYI